MSDREKLIELLKPFMGGCICDQESGSCELTDCRSCQTQGVTDYLVANGVIVQKQGRWIEKEDELMDTYYDCSVCGESFYLLEGAPDENFYNYCPNCGAKMDGEA